jgi:hypothetical protein
MSIPIIATMYGGIAQQYAWQMSPDDFEDSPRGLPLAISSYPSMDSFCDYDREFPVDTFDEPLPAILTSFQGCGHKAAPNAPHSAPGALQTGFPQQPDCAAKPKACLLATGLSRIEDNPQVSASLRWQEHAADTMRDRKTTPEDFDIATERSVKQEQMCDYCHQKAAVYRSNWMQNPEVYCDHTCRAHGDSRYCGERAEFYRSSGGQGEKLTVRRSDHVLQKDCDYFDACQILGDERWSERGAEVPKPADDNNSFLSAAPTPSTSVDAKKKGRGKKSTPARTKAANPNDVREWADGTTTVMMKNIPSRYTVEEVVSEMIRKNFQDQFDFLYLPMDFRTKRNKGYAFINFVSHHEAKAFHSAFHGVQLLKYGTQKIVEIGCAATQGLEANLAVAKKDKSRVANPWFRPMVFGAGPE